MKGPVQKAIVLRAFLQMINMIGPGKVIADPGTKEFNTANSFDWFVVHQELHVRIRILLGSNGHDFGLTDNCCQMIRREAVVDSINVFLEIRQVRFTGDGLVQGGVISLEYQGTDFGEIRETKVLSIDTKKQSTQDRTLGNSRDDRESVECNTMNSNNLCSIGKA